MEKLNIAEILKDCPKGMELDCTIISPVFFDSVTDAPMIKCYTENNVGGTVTYNSIYFHVDGSYLTNSNAKCVIFPKGKTTWEGFQRPFKDGDVLAYTSSHTTVFIYQNKDNEPKYTTSFYVGYTIGGSYCTFSIYNKHTLVALNGNCNTRLATEEEKQKLFDAIKTNGYKWNPETKTLEKLIVPKFKVGDKIRHKDDKNKTLITITGRKDDYYFIQFYNIRKNDYQSEKVSFKDQDKYELVPNKFDITTLKPFESKVLVRTSNHKKWVAAFYSHYDKDSLLHHCVVGGLWYEQCVPYNGNEHLLDTTNDCDEYYKTWE